MSVIRKGSSAILKIRDTRSVNDGTVTKVETWTGPYDLLETKQNEVGLSAKASSLAPDGPNGTLQITYEIAAPVNYQFTGSETITEVIWQELRKPIEQHKMFDGVTVEEKKMAQDAAATPGEEGKLLAQQLGTDATKLYEYLVNGTTDYCQGVPVVRRTKTRRNGTQGGGRAWVRDSPPVHVPGSWQWLKTSDERRRDGKSFTLVEEWTGAEKWDEEIYP